MCCLPGGKDCPFPTIQDDFFWYSFCFRSVRSVPTSAADKIIPDNAVHSALSKLFHRFHDALAASGHHQFGVDRSFTAEKYKTNLDLMEEEFGFAIERRPSLVKGGGTGVVVTRGSVKRGEVVAMYPGK